MQLRSLFHRLFAFAVSVIAAILLLVAIFTLYANTPPGKRQISSLASDALAREVVFAGSAYPIFDWPLTMRVSGLTVANMKDGRHKQMADIGVMEIAADFLPLFKGEVSVTRLSLVDSELHLERATKDRANWIFVEEKDRQEASRGIDMSALSKIYLRNSVITYLDIPSNSDITLTAATKANQLFLKGEGKHLGKAFHVRAQTDSLAALQTKTPLPVQVTLNVGHTVLAAHGEIDDARQFKGVRLRLKVEGADASELFPLFGIALPPTPPYALEGALTEESGRWHFNNFKGRLGDSDLSGDLTWDTVPVRPKLMAQFVSRRLYFKDLGPLIGAAPEAEEAVSAEQKEKLATEQASPYAIPDVPLDISRMAAMDADITFTGKQVVSDNLPLDDFYMKVRLDDRLLELKPIQFGTANGDIAAYLTVNARQEPVVNEGEFQFRRLSLARLMEGLGKAIPNLKEAEGFIGGTMHLKGVGKSLHDMLSTADGEAGIGMEGGKISNLLIELIGLDIAQSLGFFLAGDKPIPIRCVVGSFEVKKGIAHTKAFVIDTTDTKIEAKGSVNLGNEKLDLVFRAAPKDATIISLRSPIRVRGTLKNPDASIDKKAIIARGAAATALVVLAPIVGIFAFVEPSLGENSNCAGLIREMNANTGKSKDTNLVPKNKP